MTPENIQIEPDRRAALLRTLAEAAEAEVAAGRPADVWLTAWLRAHPGCGARDRRRLSGMIFALFRWRGWAGSVARDGFAALARAGALDGRPAAEWTACAAAAGLDPAGWPPPAPDADLNARATALARWTGGAAPPVAALVPEWMPAAVDAAAVGPLEPLMASLQSRPPLWLRAVGISGADLVARLAGQGIAARVHPALGGAVATTAHPHLPGLEKAIGFRFEVQDLASQAVLRWCAAQRGERWLDACAGAGGKTLALAEAVGADGGVWATDVRPRALQELTRRARRANVERRITTAPAGARIPPADGVLADAPCSGLGTWSRNPDARWRVTPADVDRLAALQTQILDAAANAVRPGGRLVYSVCTLTRAETTGVARAFEDRHPEFRPDPGAHPLRPNAPCVAAGWVLPADGPCSGMFFTRWRRAG